MRCRFPPLAAAQIMAWVLLAGCASSMNERGPVSVGPPNSNFLALGDSYTIGEGVPTTDRWPERLAATLRAEGLKLDDPQIIARTTWTTERLSAAIDTVDPRGERALVTLLIGVNNQYRGHTPEAYRGVFEAMLARAIGFAASNPRRVIVLSIPDWSVTPFARDRDPAAVAAAIVQYNAVAREETERAGAAWIDVTPVSRGAATDSTLLAPDGLHPSGRMYEAWIRLVLPVARTALATAAR